MIHYSGGCQCGKVRYEADLDLAETVACNCSRCGKLGAILAFTPVEKFQLLSGDDVLKEYKFNKHVIQHLFCAECGIQPFARAKAPTGADMVAVNARTLDDVEPEKLSPRFYDGRSK